MSNQFETVSIIGLGYIGLPTAATLASRQVSVIGVDVNEKVVESINEGKAHFFEPDLDILLNSTVAGGMLRASTEPQPADAFIIAVPTPFREDHRADLSYVEQAARNIAKVLRPGNLVILESTSPVGATEQMCRWLAEERSDLRFPHECPEQPDINVAYCPERILPGRILLELVENDRIIGGMTPECANRAKALYGLFVRGKLHMTTAPTAELVKLMENAYRDVNIAFANEMSLFCDKFGLDVWEAIELANHHPRVNILRPGPGVGGHCIAVDPWFLISSAPDETRLLRAAREVNDSKPHFVLDKVREQMRGIEDPVVACLGLAYKPDIDDLRESPALQIVETLAREGQGKLLVVEPNIEEPPKSLLEAGVEQLAGLDEALEQANIILLLVAHKQFSDIDRHKLQDKVVIDTVGLWRQVRTA